MKTKRAYWACQIVGWGGYSISGIFMTAAIIGWSFHLMVGYVLFAAYSIALTDVLRRAIKKRGTLDSMRLRTAGELFLAAIVLAALQSFLVCAVDLAFQGRSSFVISQPAFVPNLFISVSGANCIWLLFYVVLSAPARYREREVRLQLALREAELRALEAQINPHFLFNCLNSIRALVVENPAIAQDMLTRFANILRYNLNRDVHHTVSLASEMEVVSDYLALEAVRLEDRLRVQVTIAPDAARMQVPPMLLQMLVENAMKHGIAKVPGGGDLAIRAAVENESLAIEVLNTGRLEESNGDGTKLGLKNTRDRLRILYGEKASLELANRDGGVAATVLIPRVI
jgi:LytS/YehU family sensor histidine kinase